MVATPIYGAQRAVTKQLAPHERFLLQCQQHKYGQPKPRAEMPSDGAGNMKDAAASSATAAPSLPAASSATTTTIKNTVKRAQEPDYMALAPHRQIPGFTYKGVQYGPDKPTMGGKDKKTPPPSAAPNPERAPVDLWAWAEGWVPDPVTKRPPTPNRKPKRKGMPAWPKARDMKPTYYDPYATGFYVPPPEHYSDSNGDPDYDIKRNLVDFKGDWCENGLVAQRCDWYDRHFEKTVEKWNTGVEWECMEPLNVLDSPSFQGVHVENDVVTINGMVVAPRTTNKEIAPQCWAPSIIENEEPGDYWISLAGRAPKPVDEEDMDGQPPFWARYQDGGEKCCFLNPLQDPEPCILDPTDEENTGAGAKRSTEDLIREEARKKVEHLRKLHLEKKKKQERKQERKQETILPKPLVLPPPEPGYCPKSNVYFRPVMGSDCHSIRSLYGHYVNNTVSAPEFEVPSINAMINRINRITKESLPFLVAIAKGCHDNGQAKFVNEKVVGIMFMDDFCDKGSLYRYTFELKCYIHPQYLRQNVATCLMDRFLEMVDNSYMPKGGYEYINRHEYLKSGSGRVVKTINCHVPHADSDDVSWMTTFMKKFNFAKSGRLNKMGYKLGKVVDVTVYQYTTNETIDAHVRPFASY